jgi:Flp pilus assembly pilin Flp
MHRFGIPPSWLAPRQRGQGFLEFGLIIVAVAVPVIILLMHFGSQVGTMFNTIAGSIQ